MAEMKALWSHHMKVASRFCRSCGVTLSPNPPTPLVESRVVTSRLKYSLSPTPTCPPLTPSIKHQEEVQRVNLLMSQQCFVCYILLKPTHSITMDSYFKTKTVKTICTQNYGLIILLWLSTITEQVSGKWTSH